MKKISFVFIVISFLISVRSGAQVSPDWTRDINALPDSADVFPVRLLHDDSSHVLVLSTYMKTLSPGNYEFKIYLKKYDETGGLIWSFIYDNSGTDEPRGFDMVMDPNGNCYIAGGLMASGYGKPLILKVDAGGSIAWQRDSTFTFDVGNYDQVFYNHNRLYVKGSYGIAKFDLDGNELWSYGLPVGRMAVDHAGQSIVSVYFGNPTNILRYDSLGVLNFLDTTINANRIATDYNNNFYLLSDNYPEYELVKYDSAGNFAWSRNSFTNISGFGDIGFDVLTDFNNDVILVGLADSIYKLSPSGNLVWKKSMHQLDNYLISAKIVANNLIAVAGTPFDSIGYNMKVATFDLNGNENWSGIYSGNPQGTEFAVDITMDPNGIYAIENNNRNTTLAKFAGPFQSVTDYNLFCIDSVWYDPGNPDFVNVNVFNGNFSHLNYPSVMAVSSTGDTIINPHNSVNFFAHLGNSYQTYHDTITLAGITDFTGYSFFISENFGDTIVPVGWCGTTGIVSVQEIKFLIYPNPARDELIIDNYHGMKGDYVLQIFNSIGSMMVEEKLFPGITNRIPVSAFADGIYFGRLVSTENISCFKFIKE